MLHFSEYYRRHLPHIQPPGATFFVTCRLAGSLPVEVQQALAIEAQQLEKEMQGISDGRERTQALVRHYKALFGQWDSALDRMNAGPCWLGEPPIAEIVVSALRHFAGERYELHSYCVMPNHLHLLLTPLERTDGDYHPLSQIMHSIKRHTAREANRALQRNGAFWQHESYDHFVRDDDEHERIVAYILNNPVKAGLVAHWQDWEWSYPLDGGIGRG